MKRSNLVVSIYAATTQIFIYAIGKLMVAEIFAIFTLPFTNINKLLIEYKELKTVINGLTVFLIVQIISDIINNSSPSDYLRGWALIIFTMISTIFMVKQLSKNYENILYYLFFIFLIRLLFGEQTLDLSEWKDNTNLFKARFVGFLNPLIMLLSYYFHTNKNHKKNTFLFLFYAIICMIFDARSNGLIFIMSSVLIYIKTAGLKLNGPKLILWSLLFSFFLYLGYIYYVNQVLYNGFGGQNSQSQLSMTTNPYNPFELLLYGRSEFPVLFQAAIDKPIWGHGSWGKDPSGHYAYLTSLISGIESNNTPGYIRAHSVFLGSWAYSGIFGFIAIFIIFYKLFKKSIKIYKSNIYNRVLPIIIVLSVDMVWSFLFSPLGLLRTTFPIFAAIIITNFNDNTINNKI